MEKISGVRAPFPRRLEAPLLALFLLMFLGCLEGKVWAHPSDPYRTSSADNPPAEGTTVPTALEAARRNDSSAPHDNPFSETIRGEDPDLFSNKILGQALEGLRDDLDMALAANPQMIQKATDHASLLRYLDQRPFLRTNLGGALTEHLSQLSPEGRGAFLTTIAQRLCRQDDSPRRAGVNQMILHAVLLRILAISSRDNVYALDSKLTELNKAKAQLEDLGAVGFGERLVGSKVYGPLFSMLFLAIVLLWVFVLHLRMLKPAILFGGATWVLFSSILWLNIFAGGKMNARRELTQFIATLEPEIQAFRRGSDAKLDLTQIATEQLAPLRRALSQGMVEAGVSPEKADSMAQRTASLDATPHDLAQYCHSLLSPGTSTSGGDDQPLVRVDLSESSRSADNAPVRVDVSDPGAGAPARGLEEHPMENGSAPSARGVQKP